jgi:hypothetical protein
LAGGKLIDDSVNIFKSKRYIPTIAFHEVYGRKGEALLCTPNGTIITIELAFTLKI